MIECICTKSTKYFDFQGRAFNRLDINCTVHNSESHTYKQIEIKFLIKNKVTNLNKLTVLFNDRFNLKLSQRSIEQKRNVEMKKLGTESSFMYTKEQNDFLIKNLDLKRALLTAKFNRKFGTNKLVDAVGTKAIILRKLLS